jgi:UDP-3-O-[3-hydroxymyristoyl] glucosamine N-acyltransferase
MTSQSIHQSAEIGADPFCFDSNGKRIPGREPVSADDGVYIGPLTVVQLGTERVTYIGRNTKIDAGCHIGHDATIGPSCTIAARAVLAGHVTLEANVYIGIGALIRQHIRVGEGAFIGAGAVVVKDVPPGCMVVGNPARFLKLRWTIGWYDDKIATDIPVPRVAAVAEMAKWDGKRWFVTGTAKRK